jgi:4,5-dihydroxyphthalate decarboxylase
MALEKLVDGAPEIDFLESALIGFLQQCARGIAIKALPVFVRASFRHSYIFVNENSRIESPKDLEGKRVGIRYAMSANVWARALLQHDYGVRMEKIHWLNQERARRPL